MKTVVAEVVSVNGQIEYTRRCFTVDSDDRDYIATFARYTVGPFFAIGIVDTDIKSQIIYG